MKKRKLQNITTKKTTDLQENRKKGKNKQKRTEGKSEHNQGKVTRRYPSQEKKRQKIAEGCEIMQMGVEQKAKKKTTGTPKPQNPIMLNLR